MWLRRFGLMIVLAGWLYLLFFRGLAARDLWNSHEARAAMNAQSVLDSGRLYPQLYDGQPELQKPPLYYWLVALAARLRGGLVDAWAVRLPSAVAALVCAAAMVAVGWGSGRKREGQTAAVLLLTALHFTWLGRVGRIDMPLTAAVSVALCSLYLARRQNKPALRRGWLALAYVSTAAAVLLKGPIGVVLPAAGFGAHLLAGDRRDKPGGSLGLWWGVPLVLVLTVPWFWWANHETGGAFFRVFFWYHNVGRGLGGSQLRGHPWWFYGPRLLLDFAPWSVLLPAALWLFWRRGWWRQDAEARFGLAWLLAMFVVLSCARYKRADYLVPAYPGAALFLGCTLCRWCRHAPKERRQGDKETRGQEERFCPPISLSPCLLVSLSPCLLVSAFGWWVRVEFTLPAAEPGREHRSFARVVRRHVPTPRPILLFRTEAHALAFHVGAPVRVLRHWDELDRCAEGHVVMPVAIAAAWRKSLQRVTLEEVARNTDGVTGHEKPLVLFRILPCAATVARTVKPSYGPHDHAGPSQVASGGQGAAQSGAAARPGRGKLPGNDPGVVRPAARARRGS
jgi:hypothetical protein